MSTICILVGAPRSGTSALGDAVTRSFGAVWPQEIFNKEHADPTLDYRSSQNARQRYNFFNFRHELLQADARLSYPSKENQRAIFERYVDYLVTDGNGARYLLDIKYSSWHHLNHYFHFPYQEPYLLDLIRKHGFSIVHLKRRNLFALYCSLRLAEQTNVWWTDGTLKVPGQRLAINLGDCRRSLTEIALAQSTFDAWFALFDVRILVYEDLFVGQELCEEVKGIFADIYGALPNAPLVTKHRKIASPLREVVQNSDQVLAALHDTPFQAMAEEALR
jgi:LPS sulfotransferase NodH